MENKYCISCKEDKPLSEFYVRRGSHTHSYCKACVNEQTKQRQRALKEKAVEYKGGKCEDCGITGHPCIFDFHHANPGEKDFALSQVRSLKWSDKHIKELDKCVLLCANCHRVRHVKY